MNDAARILLVIVPVGMVGGAIAIRGLMIESAMVGEMMKADPTFKPSYQVQMFSFDPKVRLRHLFEYKKRFPQGRLLTKMRHTFWAWGAWALVGFAAVFQYGR